MLARELPVLTSRGGVSTPYLRAGRGLQLTLHSEIGRRTNGDASAVRLEEAGGVGRRERKS